MDRAPNGLPLRWYVPPTSKPLALQSIAQPAPASTAQTSSPQEKADKEEPEAATKIQAIHRGNLARKATPSQDSSSRDTEASTDRSDSFEGTPGPKEIREGEGEGTQEESAASCWRSHLGSRANRGRAATPQCHLARKFAGLKGRQPHALKVHECSPVAADCLDDEALKGQYGGLGNIPTKGLEGCSGSPTPCRGRSGGQRCGCVDTGSTRGIELEAWIVHTR